MWKTFQSNLQIATPCKKLVEMFCMGFRNFVALVYQVKHFLWQCAGTSWFSFLLLLPSAPWCHKKILSFVFSKLPFPSPVPPWRHPFTPFPDFSAPWTVTPCNPTTIHFCSKMQKYPTVTNNQKACCHKCFPRLVLYSLTFEILPLRQNL